MSSGVLADRIHAFQSSLASDGGEIAVCADSVGAFAVDGRTPEVVVTPSSETELASVLTEAHAFGLAVIPFGGGKHVQLGNLPSRYEVAVSTARLNRIVAHDPADLTVTAEAGVQVADLEALLAKHNQFLPLDPPCNDRATVGGLIGSGVYGPLRHAFGTVRDWLIGVRVVHADGRASKAGGRVVKNVAGYEMTKLYAGSLGTLGVISEATFKLMPSPPAHQTYVVYFDSAHGAATFAFAMQDAGLSLHCVEVLSPPAAFAVLGEARWSLLIRTAGTRGGVERSLREMSDAAAGLRCSLARIDDDVWARWKDVFAGGELALRVSVPPSAVADVIDVLDRRFAGAAATLSATLSVGVVRAILHPTSQHTPSILVEHARDVATQNGGYAVVDSAPLPYKLEHDVFGPLSPDVSIMKRIKDQLDPRHTLSPGRFVGRL